MAFSAKLGAFNTSTAAATNTVAVTGVGFQPKAILFWWSGLAGTIDANSGGNIKRGFGVATSATSRWAISTQSEEAAGNAATDRSQYEDACIATILIAGTVDGLMDLQSMDSDGFTLIIDDAFAADYRIHYMALGGTDLTNASTGRWDEPAATGTQDITTAGFQPDFVLFGSTGSTVDPPSIGVTALMMIGAAASSTQEAVLLNVALDAGTTMDTSAYARADEVIAFGGGVTGRAEFDSFLSNGFRLNWLERSADRITFYLALKGGSYRVDNFLTSVTGAATITETGFGFAPKGTMLFSHGQAVNAASTVSDHDMWNVGGFTSTTERGTQGTLDEDAQANADLERYVEHDQALSQYTTTPSKVGVVNVQSIDADGFTLVMDTAANPAAFVWYVSFGSASGAATVTPATIAVVAALPTPTILAAALVAPAVIPVTVSLPTPTIAITAVVAPAVIAVTTTLPTPTVQAASSVTPAVIPVTVSLPTPTISVVGAGTVTPAVIAVTVSLPTPTVLAAAKVTPLVIPVTLTLPTSTIEVSEASTVSPATIAVSVSLPTPTITSAMVVTPAGITVVMTLPTPAVSTPGLVTPAGISLVVTLPTPLATVGAITFWEKDPVGFVKVGPGDQPPWN